MRGFWKRGEGLDVERELRSLRPQPADELVRSIAARVEPRRRSHGSLRAAFAVGLSAMLVAALVGTGGVGYAAAPAKRAATVVKKVFVPKGVVAEAKRSPAIDQYVKPKPKKAKKIKKKKKKSGVRGVTAKAKPRFTG